MCPDLRGTLRLPVKGHEIKKDISMLNTQRRVSFTYNLEVKRKGELLNRELIKHQKIRGEDY